jgi:hypothetical protein
VTVSDEQIRELLATYVHCRKFAQTGYVGSNAVTIIAALEELLERRANDISQRVAGAEEEVLGCSRQSQKDDLGAASTRWASSVVSKRWPQGTDG